MSWGFILNAVLLLIWLGKISMYSIADTLIDARLNSRLIPAESLESIATLSVKEGQTLQKQVVQNVEERGVFGRRVGWKCGATNAQAQATLDCGPFFGPLYSNHIFPSETKLSLKAYPSIMAAEAEYCIRMKRSCPPMNTAYTLEEVWDSIESVSPAIEIAATRLSGKFTAGAIIADFAWNGAVVLGSPIDKQHLTVNQITTSQVALHRNGNVAATATGANVLDGPVLSVHWLVNELISHGEYIEAGDIIMTGAACVLKNLTATRDTAIEAVFSGLLDQTATVILNVTD